MTKRFLSLILCLTLAAGLCACGADDGISTGAETAAESATTAPAGSRETPLVLTGDYTATAAVESLGDANPLKSDPAVYTLSALLSDSLYIDSWDETYTVCTSVCSMAAGEPVDRTAYYASDRKEYGIPAEALEGYAYSIPLNTACCFEDGTAITADTYVESLRRLLEQGGDRARTFLEQLPIALADRYGSEVPLNMVENAEHSLYSLDNAVKNEDGTYSTPEGYALYWGLSVPIQNWIKGRSLTEIAEEKGQEVFDMSVWDRLLALQDENGYVRVSEESNPLFEQLLGTEKWNADWSSLPNYWFYAQPESEVEWENVGIFASGEYELTVVLSSPLSAETLYDSLNLLSGALVNTKLYDSTARSTGSNITSSYGSSPELSCSYGPYRLERLTLLTATLVRNEKWSGYTDSVHSFCSEADGCWYRSYAFTELTLTAETDSTQLKKSFIAGELLWYDLMTGDEVWLDNAQAVRLWEPETTEAGETESLAPEETSESEEAAAETSAEAEAETAAETAAEAPAEGTTESDAAGTEGTEAESSGETPEETPEETTEAPAFEPLGERIFSPRLARPLSIAKELTGAELIAYAQPLADDTAWARTLADQGGQINL